MARHPVPQQTQQGVVKLGGNARHVHQRRYLRQAEEQKQCLKTVTQKKDARDASDRRYSDWVLLLSHLSSWMCMAFLVKLPSLSSFSPRPQRRAASPGQTEHRFDD